ncbi:MAG: hypothetical protein ACXAC7_12170, partial [Candidatus Hodarchaeales archaeon]
KIVVPGSTYNFTIFCLETTQKSSNQVIVDWSKFFVTVILNNSLLSINQLTANGTDYYSGVTHCNGFWIDLTPGYKSNVTLDIIIYHQNNALKSHVWEKQFNIQWELSPSSINSFQNILDAVSLFLGLIIITILVGIWKRRKFRQFLIKEI